VQEIIFVGSELKPTFWEVWAPRIKEAAQEFMRRLLP
jgi:hypothetical protein